MFQASKKRTKLNLFFVSGETITYRHSCTFLKGKIDTEFVDESSDESKRGDCDAFIVTFDMSNRNSLQAILSPLQVMRQNRQPFVVIGCKKDTVAFMTNKEREVLENKCQVAHIFCVSAREPKVPSGLYLSWLFQEFDEIRRAFGHLYSQGDRAERYIDIRVWFKFNTSNDPVAFKRLNQSVSVLIW